ncbi:tetratricopeptide repeat protein [Streptomyces sp. HNM0575]|nr:tetratricopeptide repeat protein [Streptomyces sp. HNM0575]
MVRLAVLLDDPLPFPPVRQLLLLERAIRVRQAAAQKAVAIRRELAATAPERFRPDLANSLNNLGNRLSKLGRVEEALASVQEAVGLYRELAAAAPERFRPDLANSLNNLGTILSTLGRNEEGQAHRDEVVALADEPDE